MDMSAATAAAADLDLGSRLLQNASSATLVGAEPTSAIGVAGQADVSGPLNTLAEICSNLLLFLLIFGMSATVDMKNLVKQLHNKFAILTGVTMQFLIMPLLGYLTILALKNHGFTQYMGITLLIVTASPGGSYSNWWCSLFNADLALSVTMTAISTVLSVAMLPANLLLYTYAAYGFTPEEGEQSILESVDFKTLFISLAIVIIAIFTGLYASYKVHSPRFQRWSNKLGSVSGILLIVFSAAISTAGGVSNSEASGLWEMHWSFYVGVAAPCFVGLILANWFGRLARLSPPERMTVAVECCYQNVGIATSAAIAMFDDPVARAEALSVPLFYGGVEAILVGLYCVMGWKLGWSKAPKEERLCVVISKTYEIVEEEDGDNLADVSIEVEYQEPTDGAAPTGRVLGAAAAQGVSFTTASSPQGMSTQDLELGGPPPHAGPPARSRLESADTFPENPPTRGFHLNTLDRIVTFFNAGKRRRNTPNPSAHFDPPDLKKDDTMPESEDALSNPSSTLTASRERTRTEATAQSGDSAESSEHIPGNEESHKDGAE